MTVIFTFMGSNYISPSFKEAERFLKFWGAKERIREFKTTWIITEIEKAPSYGQMVRVDLSMIEYGKKI